MFACEPAAGIDDGMRPVDDLELLVPPGRALGALVRAVADLDRLLRQRLGRVGGVEDELGHLPVALVGVVEVVEGVEEPVLERELARVAGIGRDVGVHRRLRALRQAPRPELVVAAGVERVAREVEVVLVAVVEIGRRGPDLDEVGAVPRARGARRSAPRRARRRRSGCTARPGRTPPAGRRAGRPARSARRDPPRARRAPGRRGRAPPARQSAATVARVAKVIRMTLTSSTERTRCPPQRGGVTMSGARDRHRHEGRSLAAPHAAGQLGVHHVPGRGGGSAGARLPGRLDPAPLPVARDRRPARDAEGARRLDAARRRR